MSVVPAFFTVIWSWSLLLGLIFSTVTFVVMGFASKMQQPIMISGRVITKKDRTNAR